MKKLEKTLNKIEKVDIKKMKEAENRLDQLTKPKGSLGKLEKMAVKLAGISSELYPNFEKKTHIVMAGDHGVVAEGVSAFPQEVTTQMVDNFLNNGAAINVLAAEIGTEIQIVDMGMVDNLDKKDLIIKKVKNGTDNMIKGRAMTREEAVQSLEAGIDIAEKYIKSGSKVIGIGEMGIGNTTASSAIIAAITKAPLKDIVGFGTGLDPAGVEHKMEIIKTALEVNNPDPKDAVDILSAVGGLEIAGMAGVILGAAANKVPVIMDGLISGASALIAQKLKPEIVAYLIPSHNSVEPGHKKVYEQLELSPFLDLDMRLGEGTGAVLAMPFLDTSVSLMKKMATFEEAAVNNSQA
ncbi:MULTISPECIES: nicotinate-nucleotide--dimethylbenzimidazole phosphoribosyltransferase [unclassified Candidatus Frackibacter]|jgi:nicotinate-nucleotide--dimethylbenzimidazole phosphoribosyltransferase|uniref:nicotinate-nucleotide--dimethylbenzimidazole phosphoribosyltransferase n=1 Tax=unclassified Candidatus Frackibacter TaxID=2648818 RepID=UPI0008924388|nr:MULTISPECIES: nicotinate-nucleotide--dimethylbenzimidazole phosphoribosyltransferase [unclassified Candidatus Frackibacter]SDC89721.1 nicotinate-nucleotide-dimethylbenzimidazole phosphoribosyltransferase [Candidatus Frackibacter sp. WG11]SEN03422.1 nicotinate-nucleotide-dimethylbenzimidazole phosphoribosyltransferase [Candidatus Frackibacter sp. WG12]SFM11630.1 nicotinate-nucleotide-dimethylbenzimidazole phosphoribosyltransferase [Candidatus Frackibacter sp. WG13]